MKSKFKGVSHDAQTELWKAQIFIAGKNRNLGRFDTEEEAASMWDTARVRLGSFFADPVPALNVGYDRLFDQDTVEELRERLEAEGAPKFTHKAPQSTHQEPQSTQPAPRIENPVARRALLCAEASRLTRKLSEVLRQISEINT